MAKIRISYKWLNVVIFFCLCRIETLNGKAASHYSIPLLNNATAERDIAVKLIREAIQRSQQRKVLTFLQKSRRSMSAALLPLSNQVIARKRLSTVREFAKYKDELTYKMFLSILD